MSLVLARACAAGNDRAWEIFLNRYRATLYESAYKIAKEESAARGLADSLYADLYGVNEKGRQRASKLLYYQGRGSLQGWLRTVVAQEYVNRYRSTKREISLDAGWMTAGSSKPASRTSRLSILESRPRRRWNWRRSSRRNAFCWLPTTSTAERWRRSQSCNGFMSPPSAASWSA